MASEAHSGRLHVAITVLLGAAVALFVVAAAYGLVEIRYVGRAGSHGRDAAGPKPPTRAPAAVPEVSRIEGTDGLIRMLQTCALVNECQVFRYSGGFVEFELEVETDGKKKVFGQNLGPQVRLLALASDSGSSEGREGPVAGHVLWVQRPTPDRPLKEMGEVWDLAMSVDGRPALGIRGIPVPPGAGRSVGWTQRQIGAGPVKLGREVILWQRRLFSDLKSDEGPSHIVTLKCRPTPADPATARE